MRGRKGLVWATAVAAAAGAAWGTWALARPGEPRPLSATLSLPGTLAGDDTAGYARAGRSRPFRYPEDHGPHSRFRTEWWYVSGNLRADEGRRFGVQLTVFRRALAPEASAAGAGLHESPWSTRQAYMAHLALTDVRARRFHAFERFERGALGLAGASADPFRVWVDDWELRGAASATFPVTLSARDGDVGVELVLSPAKVPVAQGDGGLSRKSPEPGNASYYYSFTRLQAVGEVVTPDGRFPVRGSAWLDREWGTSALPVGVAGWDWFALQLDDGRDVMVYRLRREDGSWSPFSDAVVVDAGGGPERLPADAVTVEALGSWASPLDGARYPSGWRVVAPSLDLDLEVRPLLEDQELKLAFRYWEGAVEVTGRGASGPVTGRGYVELTGYGGGERPSR